MAVMTPDQQARALRELQWRAHLALDAIYGPVARKADALMRANAEPHPISGAPGLSDAGRERALLAIGVVLDRADQDAADLITHATAQAARLGAQR